MQALQTLGYQSLATLVFVAIGMFFFGVAFWLMSRLAPFSLKKEIEEDQNVALGVVIGSVIIGIALIVSAAVHG
jgi:putative membrane protein